MADEVARLRIEAATDDLAAAAQRVEKLRAELENAQKAVNAGQPGWEKQAAAVERVTAKLGEAERALKRREIALASAQQAADRQDAAEAARSERAVRRAQREADAAATAAKRAADAQIRESQRAASAAVGGLASEATEQVMVGARTFRGGMRGGQWDAQKYASDLAKGAAANRDFGNAALQAAFMIDDMQYGIRGVVNNIPMLTMAFGAGAGVTGIISIAGVAISQLVTHWDDLTRAFAGTDAFTEQADRLEEFAAAADKAAEAVEGLKSGADAAAGAEFVKQLTGGLKAGETGQDFEDALLARYTSQRIDAGHEVNIEEARATIQDMLARAKEGDAEASASIANITFGAKEGGILGRFNGQQEAAKAEERAGFAAGNSANRRRTLEDDLAGVASADEFALVMDRINAAIRESALSDEDAAALHERAAEIRRKAVDAEAENVGKLAQIARDKETDELNKQGAANEAAAAPEIEEARRQNARKEARKNRRLDEAAEWYGGAWAGELNRRMLAGDARGEDAGEVDKSLTQQLAARMARSGLNEEDRLEAAARAVRQRREMNDDLAMQRGIASDAARQRYIANMAPAGTMMGTWQRQTLAAQERAQASGGLAPEGTMAGVAQRQMLARRGINPAAVARMGQINAGLGDRAAGSMPHDRAAEKFDNAAQRMERAAEKMERLEVRI